MTDLQKQEALNIASKLDRLSTHIALTEEQADILREASKIIYSNTKEIELMTAVQKDLYNFILDKEVLGIILKRNSIALTEI